MGISFYLVYVFLTCVISMAVGKCVKYEKRKKCTGIVFAICLITLSTVRAASVGSDTAGYIEFFKRVQLYDLRSVISGQANMGFETGFTVLCKLMSYINGGERWFLFWTSAISIIPLVVFLIKYSDDIRLSLVLYVLHGQFFFVMCVIRQSIALGVSFIALDIIISRKRAWLPKSILIIALATSIHTSAIIMIAVLICFITKRADFKFYSVVMLALFVALFAFDSIVGRIIHYNVDYSRYQYSSTGLGRIIVPGAVLLFYYIFKRRINSLSEFGSYWEKLVVLSMMLSALSYRFIIAAREASFLSCGIYLIIPMALNSIDDAKTRFLIKSIIVILFVIMACLTFPNEYRYLLGV